MFARQPDNIWRRRPPVRLPATVTATRSGRAGDPGPVHQACLLDTPLHVKWSQTSRPNPMLAYLQTWTIGPKPSWASGGQQASAAESRRRCWRLGPMIMLVVGIAVPSSLPTAAAHQLLSPEAEESKHPATAGRALSVETTSSGLRFGCTVGTAPADYRGGASNTPSVCECQSRTSQAPHQHDCTQEDSDCTQEDSNGGCQDLSDKCGVTTAVQYSSGSCATHPPASLLTSRIVRRPHCSPPALHLQPLQHPRRAPPIRSPGPHPRRAASFWQAGCTSSTRPTAGRPSPPSTAATTVGGTLTARPTSQRYASERGLAATASAAARPGVAAC